MEADLGIVPAVLDGRVSQSETLGNIRLSKNELDSKESESNMVTGLKDNPTNSSILETSDEVDHDSTIHGFNASNITVIERQIDILEIKESTKPLHEGSDSGVETIDAPDIAENAQYQRALSAASQENDQCAQSCGSSITSCYSNYEEAYNLLVRKNSTLLEDYRLPNGDVTSENGSESSSVSGKNVTSRCTRRNNLSGAVKKTQKNDPKLKPGTRTPKDRISRPSSKPPITPANSHHSASTTSSRLKSVERLQALNSKVTPNSRLSTSQTRTRPTPNSLEISKKDTKRVSTAKLTPGAISRTSSHVTPSDDGRWPSVHSKPAPLMTRSLKGSLLDQNVKPQLTPTESKTIEKYATLPRRKKERTSEIQAKKPSSRQSSSNRAFTGHSTSLKDDTIRSKMFSSLHLPKNAKQPQQSKTKIYHEINVQTALTMCDIDKALNGRPVSPKSHTDAETISKDVQVDMTAKDFEILQEQLRELTQRYQSLSNEHKLQTEKLSETETELKQERLEKEGLKEELTNNSQRVLAILGHQEEQGEEATGGSDSLLVLESKFQNVSQVIIQQEEEITRLNNYCRSLQLDLEKSLAAQKTLLQQHQDLEAESIELQEFMQAEKTTLSDALKEAENEIKKHQVMLSEKDTALAEAQEEVKQLTKLCDQRRTESLGLLARIGCLEAKNRELLVHQGSSVSGASVALSSLIQRIRGLVEELIDAYSISDQELEDMIYHNEAYTNQSSSSVESTPERSNSNLSSPKDKGSSFVSAVINAIRNAATGRDSKGACDRSSSNEMLDSETEPCLMMEHVLEDVVIPDGYSHNMISSGHGSMLSSRLTHSESLKDVSNAIFNRQASAPNSLSYCGSLNSSYHGDMMHSACGMGDVFSSISLVDQVIEVDNVITRLLKVIRIIQIENEDCMNELQEQRDSLSDQIDKQRETNKVVVKQLKDWEVLGARLKTEVKELMSQLTKKNVEIENLKMDLNEKREQVQRQNQDVCDLSTALAKAELEIKLKDEEVDRQVKQWNETGEVPSEQFIGRLLVSHNEASMLQEKLNEKEKRLNELNQEFLDSKQVMTESLKEALNESKRQYDAIDGALEVLHNIQPVVQQCPALSQLQRELEEVSFKTASSIPLSMPPDCNANAGMLQNGSLDISPSIKLLLNSE